MEDALAHLLLELLGADIEVLILVLMEDALALCTHLTSMTTTQRVLILVLMEDALAHRDFSFMKKEITSLNPCFNGRCTRTKQVISVLSLQSCLNPCFNGRCTRTGCKNSKMWLK